MPIFKLPHPWFLCFTMLTQSILSSGCSSTPSAPSSSAPTAAARVALAPSGTLRAAINFGNPILATRDSTTGEPRGVSVDLARELGRRLGVPVELVLYTAAGKVVEGIKSGAWDIGFFAIDPVRAADIDFTPAYVVIEGAYLVPQNSAVTRNEDVDRDGVRVVVGRGSAYLSQFVQEMKASGFVARSLERHGIEGAVVAPP